MSSLLSESRSYAHDYSPRTVSISSGEEDEEDDYGLPKRNLSCRQWIKAFVLGSWFDIIMGCVILFNVVVIIFETDRNIAKSCTHETQDSRGSCAGEAVFWLNIVLLCVYTVEIIFRVDAAEGWTQYLCDGWNLLDLFIVTSGWMDLLSWEMEGLMEFDASQLKIVKICRLARLARCLRLLRRIPALYHMVQGFASAVRAMFWGIMLIMFMLVIFALISVQLVRILQIDLEKLDDEGSFLLPIDCQDAMQSVWLCVVHFFRTLIAGDSWGLCAVPLIEMNRIMFINFGSALVVIQLGVTNLILAVIVDSSQQVAADDEQRYLDKMQAQNKKAEEIRKLIEPLDLDGNGLVSRVEVIRCLQHNAFLKQSFELLDMDDEYINSLFRVMGDQTESIPVDVLVSMVKRRGRDINARVTLIELEITELTNMLRVCLPKTRSVAPENGLLASIH